MSTSKIDTFVSLNYRPDTRSNELSNSFGARDWNRELVLAAELCYKNMAEFAIDQGAISFDEAIEAAQKSSQDKHLRENMVRWLDARKSLFLYSI